MKRFLMTLVCVTTVAITAIAAPKKAPKVDYVNATELTLIGKLCNTTNPYHRVEVDSVEGITKGEAKLLKMSSGLAIVFKTNASEIYARPHPRLRLRGAICASVDVSLSLSWGPPRGRKPWPHFPLP